MTTMTSKKEGEAKAPFQSTSTNTTTTETTTYSYRLFDRQQPEDVDGLIELIQQLQQHEQQLYNRMESPDNMNLREYIQGLEDSCHEHAGEIWVALVVDDSSSSSSSSVSQAAKKEQRAKTKMVGYAVVLTKVPSNPLEDYEIPYIYGNITDLAVHENFQRQGIARRLLKLCQERVQAAGTPYLRTDVLARNEAAMAAYQQFGFTPHLVTLEKQLFFPPNLTGEEGIKGSSSSSSSPPLPRTEHGNTVHVAAKEKLHEEKEQAC